MKNCFIGLILCCWSHLLFASSADLDLQQRLHQIKSLRAHFSQTVMNHGRLVQRSTGELSVKRPGGFRWQTTKPIHQLIVANAQTLWIYDQDLNQVTVKKASRAIATTPALFLSGNISSLSKYFKVVAAPLGNGIVYTLTPLKKRNGYRYIQLRFEGDNLVAMRLLDPLGQTTDLRLYDVRTNIPIVASQFKFMSPAGADVIRQ